MTQRLQEKLEREKKEFDEKIQKLIELNQKAKDFDCLLSWQYGECMSDHGSTCCKNHPSYAFPPASSKQEAMSAAFQCPCNSCKKCRTTEDSRYLRSTEVYVCVIKKILFTRHTLTNMSKLSVLSEKGSIKFPKLSDQDQTLVKEINIFRDELPSIGWWWPKGGPDFSSIVDKLRLLDRVSSLPILNKWETFLSGVVSQFQAMKDRISTLVDKSNKAKALIDTITNGAGLQALTTGVVLEPKTKYCDEDSRLEWTFGMKDDLKHLESFLKITNELFILKPL